MKTYNIDFDSMAKKWLYEWRKYLVDVGLISATVAAVAVIARRMKPFRQRTFKSLLREMSKNWGKFWALAIAKHPTVKSALASLPSCLGAGASATVATAASTVAWGVGILLTGLFIIDSIFEGVDFLADISQFGKLNMNGIRHDVEEINDLAAAIAKGRKDPTHAANIAIDGDALALLVLATSSYCTEPVSATATEVFQSLYREHIQSESDEDKVQVIVPIILDDPDDETRFPVLVADMVSYYKRWFVPHDFVVQMFAILFSRTRIPVPAKAVVKGFGLMEGD